jgi:hypothetical protein
MSAPSKQKKSISSINRLLLKMEAWPQSWAGSEADEPIGRALVNILRPFFLHLQEKGLSYKTIKTHLDNTWAIGGEIIREINEHPKLRKKSAKQLLCAMIEMGEAPLVTHATEAEQRSLDATAKKLCKFFLSNSL